VLSDLVKARESLEGSEFDWLLVDSLGCIALCETAGYGEVPDILLSVGPSKFDAYSVRIEQLLKLLPERCDFVEENGGFGGDTDTPAYARRGLYIYDWKHWKGPYKSIARPSDPIEISEIALHMEPFVETIPISACEFRSTSSFQLGDLIACHNLRLD